MPVIRKANLNLEECKEPNLRPNSARDNKYEQMHMSALQLVNQNENTVQKMPSKHLHTLSLSNFDDNHIDTNRMHAMIDGNECDIMRFKPLNSNNQPTNAQESIAIRNLLKNQERMMNRGNSEKILSARHSNRSARSISSKRQSVPSQKHRNQDLENNQINQIVAENQMKLSRQGSVSSHRRSSKKRSQRKL